MILNYSKAEYPVLIEALEKEDILLKKKWNMWEKLFRIYKIVLFWKDVSYPYEKAGRICSRIINNINDYMDKSYYAYELISKAEAVGDKSEKF